MDERECQTSHTGDRRWRVGGVATALMVGAGLVAGSGDRSPATMVLIEGGSFMMGDVFTEGAANERPVHRVTLSTFYLARYEVTVGEFRRFVEATGYKTSAEAADDPVSRSRIMASVTSGSATREEMGELRKQLLLLGGAGCWDAEKRQWTTYEPAISWRAPGFAQDDASPVVSVSAVDAMHYCNWVSTRTGLPAAYDVSTGALLDAQGTPTVDVTRVRGVRLPTEAEWEFAARERGREVRFGNGRNVARSAEINFRADSGDYAYLENGEYRKATTPVGSFAANSLGLYDMSGNAWEWTADVSAGYGTDALTNPLAPGERHALRGGRWGGDAFEARVFHRTSWVRNDRCNNSGFRLARSR